MLNEEADNQIGIVIISNHYLSKLEFGPRSQSSLWIDNSPALKSQIVHFDHRPRGV
ncbi:hypothetical protein GJ629_13750 [Halapricum sp. CBA1109]|uniref:hypothetical protein n=1 Tax=Halapricum sp. CBA1109 TaxID=2668068 RepID=UPI0012FCF35F|nr:hypothetical protein [Halapricum sp. CBA1109]MUV90833.1 hypothetical protein [Halapricum sp. CBA1109]